jgi:hypothetical protein
MNMSAPGNGGKCTGMAAMDDESAGHLWALRKVNEALIEGLTTAVFVMEKWDELPSVRRRSMITALKDLISQSRESYGTEGQKQ